MLVGFTASHLNGVNSYHRGNLPGFANFEHVRPRITDKGGGLIVVGETELKIRSASLMALSRNRDRVS